MWQTKSLHMAAGSGLFVSSVNDILRRVSGVMQLIPLQWLAK